MELLKKQCKNVKFDWFHINTTFGYLSHAIKSKNKLDIEKYIVQLMSILLKIAYDHDIDMHNAWSQWNSKALAKNYV